MSPRRIAAKKLARNALGVEVLNRLAERNALSRLASTPQNLVRPRDSPGHRASRHPASKRADTRSSAEERERTTSMLTQANIVAIYDLLAFSSVPLGFFFREDSQAALNLPDPIPSPREVVPFFSEAITSGLMVLRDRDSNELKNDPPRGPTVDYTRCAELTSKGGQLWERRCPYDWDSHVTRSYSGAESHWALNHLCVSLECLWEVRLSLFSGISHREYRKISIGAVEKRGPSPITYWKSMDCWGFSITWDKDLGPYFI